MTLRVEGDALLVDTGTWTRLAGAEEVDPELAQVASTVPGGEQALEAGRDPRAVVQVQTATPGGVFTHEAWVGEDALAVLLDLGRDDERRLLVLPPDHLAAALARMVGLAPRAHAPADRQARPVQEVELEAWFAPAAEAPTEAAAPRRPVPVGHGAETHGTPSARRAGAEDGADRAWRLVAAAVGSDEAPLMLAAVDGRDSGLWIVEADTDLRLVPVTPTEVWHELASVLPALVPTAGTARPDA
ncbi:hypothetical protein [Serinicoccus chungangensis]|uniref:hypothetical protein n=1 Tax=Serinicoccus chungangensis TaxID=767452 RepID=UPI00111B6852|nr:hypothetical protein [Serinicoccus chungangensis]